MSDFRAARPARVAGMSAKDEILARLRTALAVPRRDAVTEAADVPRAYQGADDPQESRTDPAKIRALLVQRLEDYTARVRSVPAGGVGAAVAEILAAEGATSVVVPPALPGAWTDGLEDAVVVDDGSLGARDLDAIDAVVTACHTAIALTGTLALRSDDTCGRRIISLMPDLHVVVVEPEQIVLGVPRAIARLAEDPSAPWTLISGPSATSDIELERVEGVHGPRRLHVVLVEPEPTPDTEPAPAQEEIR
ncbi:LutC/YkgG family protein [Brachybacterium huguangmaarense]